MPDQSRGSDGSRIRAFQHPDHTARTLADIPRECHLCPWVPRLGIKDDKPFVAYFELKFPALNCSVHHSLATGAL